MAYQKNKIAADSESYWNYYIGLRHKHWSELSEQDKERIVLAAHLILNDIGILSTLSEVKEFLKNHLPEKVNPWCESVLGGYIEWQSTRNVPT